MIYLDNNSTTKVDAAVLSQIFDLYKSESNASSAHSYGRVARVLIEKSRNKILDFLGVKDHKLVFTSSGTEANNLIISNFADRKILISSIEHPSIYMHSKYNKNILLVPVAHDGLLDLKALEAELSSADYALVSVIYANNETGVIQDNIRAISEIVHKYGACLHSDITQAVGKIEVDLKDLGIDFATFSAHKFYGPVGCGGLIYRSDFVLKPQIFGGGQEMGLRSGTENVVAIVGAARAIEVIKIDKKIEELRNYLEGEILNFAPEAIIFGKNVLRLPNTSMITMPNVDFNVQIMQFDLEGIAISAGSACSSARITESRILKEMSVPTEIARTAIRVSLSKYNTKEELDRFILVWKEIYRQGQRI